ncbi:MAG: hypothetical protein IKQ97_09665 [Eubacterium sp.]|nr:hypothetical protein [Eubacterium sp.]
MYKNRLKNTIAYYDELLSKKDEDNMLFIIAQDEMERLLVQIGFFQHERLIHLIVTALFGLATVITVPAYLMTGELSLLILGCLFIALLIPYVIHYYHLENGVQKLYLYYNQLELISNPGYKQIY